MRRCGDYCGHQGEHHTERDAAHLLDRSPRTLENWRYGEQPIPFVMRNGARYRLADLASWLLINEI